MSHLATFSLVSLHQVAPGVVPPQQLTQLPPYAGPRKPVVMLEPGRKGLFLRQIADKARAADELAPPLLEGSVSDGSDELPLCPCDPCNDPENGSAWEAEHQRRLEAQRRVEQFPRPAQDGTVVERFTNEDGALIERTTRLGRIVAERFV